VIAVILVAYSILSIFRNTESRYLKMLDFPRIQFFIMSLVCLILLWITIKRCQWYDYLAIIGLMSGLVIQGTYIINYVGLVPVDVPTANDIKTSDDTFSLLITNVERTNRKSRQLTELIELKKPDLILAMEVNRWWNEKLKVLEKYYPFYQQTINEVAYGMVF